MKSTNLTRLRFSTAFVSVLGIVGVLGAFSMWRLTDYHSYSSEIRDRFFQSTRYIGDLNNFTSDFRASEATSLLTSTDVQVSANINDIADLDRRIARSERSYEQVIQDMDEAMLYRKFQEQWRTYRAAAGEVLALSQTSRRTQAPDLYMAKSRVAYDAASDTLGALTDLNVAKAHRAALRADDAYSYARQLTAAAVGFAILLVAGGLTYIRRRVADPLLNLANAMLSLADGVTDIAVHGAKRKDELGAMARAVIRFRDSIIELAIAQRAAANQALLLGEKLAAERRLTELQRNFVTMASHEFRTPMNVIDAHAQRLIAAKDRLGPADIAQRAAKIRSAVLRLTSVIENLIGASRFTDGDPELYFHPEETDLAELLKEVFHLHREVAPRANLQYNLEPGVSSIVADRNLLFQAFSNLVSNAVKFSADGSLIKITASAEPENVVVSVEDQGFGVPPGDVAHLFERYFRGANVQSIVGTGIGLYLVKTVIDLHSGDIHVETVEGRGSRFRIRLPIGSSLPCRPINDVDQSSLSTRSYSGPMA